MKYSLLLAGTVVNAEFITYEGGPSFDITWDKNEGMMKIQTRVQKNHWLGLFFPIKRVNGKQGRDFLLF